MTAQLLFLLNWMPETSLAFAIVLAAAAASSRRVRVVLFRCAFVIALAAPVVLIPTGPKIGLFTLPVASETIGDHTAQTVGSAAAPAASAPMSRVREATPRTVSWLMTGLAAVWLAGFITVCTRYLTSLARLSRAFDQGEAPPAPVAERFEFLRRRLGVRAAARLRLSDRIATPCTFGWLRPKVLAPKDFAASPEMIEAVLAHELCHVRARDSLWIMLGRLACAAHWFNPLLRACESRHRDDIEIVCDDAVVETTMEAGAYVEALARLARRMVAAPLGAGVTMSARGIAPRLRMLLERGSPLPRPAPWLRAAIYGAGVAVLALLATTQVVAARPAAPTPAAIAATYMAASIEPRIPPLRPDEGRLYLDVTGGVTVWARSVGFMCDGARCVATVARDSRLKLTASSETPVRLRWTGCEPVEDGQACFVQVPHGPAQVTVRRAG